MIGINAGWVIAGVAGVMAWWHWSVVELQRESMSIFQFAKCVNNPIATTNFRTPPLPALIIPFDIYVFPKTLEQIVIFAQNASPTIAGIRLREFSTPACRDSRAKLFVNPPVRSAQPD